MFIIAILMVAFYNHYEGRCDKNSDFMARIRLVCTDETADVQFAASLPRRMRSACARNDRIFVASGKRARARASVADLVNARV